MDEHCVEFRKHEAACLAEFLKHYTGRHMLDAITALIEINRLYERLTVMVVNEAGEVVKRETGWQPITLLRSGRALIDYTTPYVGQTTGRLVKVELGAGGRLELTVEDPKYALLCD